MATADVGVIGMGAMGINIAYLIAEKGYRVSGFNRAEEPEKVEAAIKLAKEQKVENFLNCYSDMKEFVNSLTTPRTLFLSISHGPSMDKVIETILPFLAKKDILIDCGNEWYEETDRRMKSLNEKGINFVGMGVSGGYQSARTGPSMSPGCSREVFKQIEPMLNKIAPKVDDELCIAYIGEGGSGHYVKMLHNGIEQAMMSSVCEAYGLLRLSGFSNLEMHEAFKKWAQTPELSDNFLINISIDIFPFPDDKSGLEKKGPNKYLLDNIMDNVVQDANSSEGTGTWTVRDAAARHMPCPTILAAHTYRLTSAYRNDRVEASPLANALRPSSSSKQQLLQQYSEAASKSALVEDLRLAVYTSHLCAYIEGFNLMARASRDEKWNLDMDDNLRIHRRGCIIQSEYIIKLLREVYKSHGNNDTSVGGGPLHNLFLDKRIVEELTKGVASLRRVVALSVQHGEPCAALSATLSHIDSSYSSSLSTNLMEAQLDYFGLHCYRRIDDQLPRDKELEKSTQHTEWLHPLHDRK